MTRCLLTIGFLIASMLTSACGGDSLDAGSPSADYARAAVSYVRAYCKCTASVGIQTLKQCVELKYPEIADGECLERRLRALQTPELEPVLECVRAFWQAQEQCEVDHCTGEDLAALTTCRSAADMLDDMCVPKEQRLMISGAHHDCSMNTCDDGSTFLAYQRCDGKRHCADGSDESECF